MNTLLALGAIGLVLGASGAALVPAASLATAPTCQDLAGQGSACVDAGTGGVDVTVIVEPTIPPVAASSQADPTCQDLAGRGSACVDGTSVTYNAGVAEIGFSTSGSLDIGVGA